MSRFACESQLMKAAANISLFDPQFWQNANRMEVDFLESTMDWYGKWAI